MGMRTVKAQAHTTRRLAACLTPTLALLCSLLMASAAVPVLQRPTLEPSIPGEPWVLDAATVITTGCGVPAG
jgi:hypothetical protein